MLAYQRYGRGKAIAFPVQDSWLWQMHATMPLEDMTHENYWRQLLRWLVDGVPEHVESHTTTERVEAGETLTITAEVVDKSFVEINDARVVAHVSDPEGTSSTSRCSGPASERRISRRPSSRRRRPLHRATSKRRGTGSRSGPASMHLRAAPGDAEYFDAGMHAARLQRIAEETGGKFYTADNVTGAAGRSEVLRSWRDDRGGARPVAHADRLALIVGLMCGRVGISAGGGARLAMW